MTVRVADVAERWLADAYDLVARGWCQGATARAAGGTPVEPESADACEWSMTGALVRVWRLAEEADKVLGLAALGRANLALTAATGAIPGTWNDTPGRRQSHVLEAICEAVSLVSVVVVLAERRGPLAAAPPAVADAAAPGELGSAA